MMVPLHKDYIKNEEYRAIALECGKRCCDYNVNLSSQLT